MIAATSRKLAAEFFSALGDAIVGTGETASVEAPAPETTTPETPGLHPWIWVGGVLALVVAVLWYFGV